MAALVRYFPADLLPNLAASVEVMRGGIPEITDVLDLVALLVVGNVPIDPADKGHMCSVAEGDLRHDHDQDLGRKASKCCHEGQIGKDDGVEDGSREAWRYERDVLGLKWGKIVGRPMRSDNLARQRSTMGRNREVLRKESIPDLY